MTPATANIRRPLYFLFPKMQLNSGGHLAQLHFLEMARSLGQAVAVTYKQQEADTPFLDDVLASDTTRQGIYIIHWGTDVPQLVERLQGHHVVYVAHSTGYGFSLPARVPIIAVSRHTQSYWGRQAPNSLIYHVPNVIDRRFQDRHMERPVDVLVQQRKSSAYLLQQLVPALRQHCTVKVIDGWVDDLSVEFNQSKVYLYDSTEHWLKAGATEGFGLPPLEAMACGCTVFSGINDALSDYLDPGFNCEKLRVYSLEYDVERILQALQQWQPADHDAVLQPYRIEAIQPRFRVVMQAIDRFFDHQQDHPANIPMLDVAALKPKAPKPTLRSWLGRLRRAFIR